MRELDARRFHVVPDVVEAIRRDLHLAPEWIVESEDEDDHLLAAVRAALDKDADAAKRQAKLGDIHDKLALLSNRERQVLEALVAGHANKIIAFDLGISPRTVEIYRANVMTKMAANSLSDLVRMAMMVGVMESSGKVG